MVRFFRLPISSKQIPNEEHREHVEGLKSALELDRGLVLGGRNSSYSLDVTFHPRSTTGWASEPNEKFVVQTRYNVRDKKNGKMVFYKTGGDIYGPLSFRLAALTGLFHILPEGFRMSDFYLADKSYFPEGSFAREFLKLRGDEWMFRDEPEEIHIAPGPYRFEVDGRITKL